MDMQLITELELMKACCVEIAQRAQTHNHDACEAHDQTHELALSETQHDSPANTKTLLRRLEALTLSIAYQGFDLEATRRENSVLRATIKKAAKPRS